MGNHNCAKRHHIRNRPPVETEPPNTNYNYIPQSNNTPQNPTTSVTHNNNMTSVLLPYSHVDCSLRALAGQAEGFGRFAIGGLHGQIYHVTSLSGKCRYCFVLLVDYCFMICVYNVVLY